MTTLADRVEAVGAGSRELDAEIALALGWNQIANPTMAGGLIGRWYAPDGKMTGHDGPPRWTQSIDAALKLISPDWWLEIKGPRKYLNIPSPVPNYWSVQIATWNHESDVMGWGKTIPLAICIAALKARARQTSGL